MSFTFNLVDERWIPCIRADGAREELSLRETFAQAHILREILADTPLETAALHRLLLIILHRKFGPADRPAWRQLWQGRTAGFDMQVLGEYLTEWRHKFDLFDEKQPFLQVADESQLGDEDTVNKMVLHLTADSTLFEHTLNADNGGAVLSPAQAARAVITVHNFALGYNNFVDGPCSKGAIFLVAGDSLYETLILNLSRYPEDSGLFVSTESDAPAWHMGSPFEITIDGRKVSRDTKYVERDGKKKPQFDELTPQGQLDYLTWHNRKLKLLPVEESGQIVVRKIRWAPGMRLDSAVVDPMQVNVEIEGKGRFAIAFDSDKGLWRDSHVILRLADSSTKVVPIKAVKWLSFVARQEPELLPRTLRLIALGTAKKQAKIEFLRSELTPLPLEFLQNDDLVGHLSIAVERAEKKVAVAIQRATFLMAWLILSAKLSIGQYDTVQKLDDKFSKGSYDKTTDKEARSAYNLYLSWNSEHIYWSRLEPHFHNLIINLPKDVEAAMQTWRTHLRRAANAAFAYAENCAGSDLRSQRACAKARNFFELHLNIALKVSDPNKLTEDTLDE